MRAVSDPIPTASKLTDGRLLIVTRFPRRATILAAVLLAAPLGFALTATAAAAAPARRPGRQRRG
jgi:hypothetical protein